MTKRNRKNKQGENSEPQVRLDNTTNSTITVAKEHWWAKWGMALIAIALAWVVFYQTSNFDFVNWDDDKNFFENENITSLNKENFWENTKKIFSSGVIGNYNPLTIWTFLWDQKWFGLENTGAWHLVNLFWHSIAIFLVFFLGRKLNLNPLGALILACLFAIHPLRVESVAWVTERKDVVFGTFYIAALIQYIRYQWDGHQRALIWVFLFFILSLLSKIQAVSLPLSMMAVDYLKGAPLSWKIIWSKWPYLLLSLIVGVIGIQFLGEAGSLDTNTNTYATWQRLFVGSYSYMIYLVKSIVPYKMLPLYPYKSNFPAFYYPSILLVPTVIWALWKAHRKGYKEVVFGITFFTVNIIFLLQILGAGQGFLADRFSYISFIGLFYIYAYVAQQGINLPKFRNLVAGLAAVILIGYTFISYKQTGIWKNSDTLWSHVLKYHDDITLPWGNRANYYRKHKMIDKAIYDYGRAIALKEDPQTFNSRARLYFDLSNNRDTLLLALADYNKAIELKPGDGEFYTNRGATFARLGDMENALKDLSAAIQYKPDHAVAYLNRSIMYNVSNRVAEARADIATYLQLQPYNADMWYEKGRAEVTLQLYSEALASHNRAIQLNANNYLFYYGRAQAKEGLGDLAGAKADLKIAVDGGLQGIDPAMRGRLGI